MQRIIPPLLCNLGTMQLSNTIMVQTDPSEVNNWPPAQTALLTHEEEQ